MKISRKKKKERLRQRFYVVQSIIFSQGNIDMTMFPSR